MALDQKIIKHFLVQPSVLFFRLNQAQGLDDRLVLQTSKPQNC